MKKISLILIISTLLLMLFGMGCDKKNPTEPFITEGVSRTYSSVQVVGTFNDWGISDPVNDLVFQGEHIWEKQLALTSGTYDFKFTTGYSWDNDNFGENETPAAGIDPVLISGIAEKNGGNIAVTITSSGNYKFIFNDQNFEYSVENVGYIPEITNYTISSISSADTFTFRCQATDLDGAVSWVKVHFWNNAGGSNTEQIEILTNTTGNTYISTVKAPSSDGEYTYYFEARDNDKNLSYYPSNAPTSKETLVVSDTIIIDGVIDTLYGIPIASDPNTDGNGNDVMDLVDLYVYDDADNYYFLFTIDGNTGTDNWGKYMIYIDTTNNTNGATLDAWSRAVIVNDNHKPEYALNCWVDDLPFGTTKSQLYSWNGITWDPPGEPDEAALFSGTISIIEYRVAKSKLGNPVEIWIEVWGTGNGGADNAQDTINNPADDWNAGDWTTQSDLDCTTHYVNQN